MIVTRLELRNVTVHECFVLDLPARGVVLVTGPNGSGKSTLVEAVSVAGWDTPLRGKPCWTSEPGQIIMHAQVAGADLNIDRRRTNGKNFLQFDETKYDTASKAQAALDPLIGSHELWRRSSAFSSRDSAHFTESSDADRKRLLESVLGLDLLDAASGLVRKDIRECSDLVSAASHQADLLEQKVSVLADQFKQDATELSELQEPEDKPVDEAELRKRRQSLEHRALSLQEPLTDFNYRLAQKEKELEIAKAQCVKLNAWDHCPSCGQSVPPPLKLSVLNETTAMESDLEADKRTLIRRTSNVQGKLDKVKENIGKLSDALSLAVRVNINYANYLHAKYHLAKRVKLRRAELQTLSDEQDEASAKLYEARQRLSMLGLVDKVLSTKGVRAHLLHNALSVIEATSNMWLSRIAGKELRLHLTPYTEKSSGGVKDAIGLEIEGAGGGHGYKAASGGERRRIDIALMLALGDIARASSGGEPGTLFLDEVLDALDADGVDAVCDVMHDLAQTRCLVIISHNEDVVRGLRSVHEHVRLGT